MVRKIALWASFIVTPGAVIIAGPSLMSGFDIPAPASTDALAVIRDGGFIASCAPAFAAYAKAVDANPDAIRCIQDHGEALMAISLTPITDAPQSADNNQIALAIPVEYGKRFQGRTAIVEINAKCPEAACDIVASADTGYTDRPFSRNLRFASEFSTGSIEMVFPARDPDDIVDGPSISFSYRGENPGLNLVIKSVTMALTDG